MVTTGCVLASARRVALATAPTALHPEVLAARLRPGRTEPADEQAVRGALAAAGEGSWERDLVEALAETGVARTGAVNEQLGELDYLGRRWARVPRVCASVASSSGFLLASLALRDGLAAGSAPEQTVLGAIDVAAVGIAGAVLCVAAQHQASRAAKAKLTAADVLVERLERAPKAD